MAVIQDFSTELLYAVFQMVQVRDKRPRSSGSLRRYRSRLHSLTLLSLVCKSWHRVILEYGALWASIPVDTSRPGYLESTSTMLKRSNGAELKLSVHLDAGLHDLDRTRSIVRIFAHRGVRIKSLHLMMDSRNISNRGLELSETAANAIASISEFICPEPHPTAQHTTNPFRGLSNLSLSLPSSTVVVNLSVILNIIISCPELVYLRLASFLLINEDCTPTASVRMPNLLRLSLRRCDSATILSHVVTPKTSSIDVVMNPRRTRPSLTHTHILTAFPHLPTNIHALEETTNLTLEEDESDGGFRLGLSPLSSRTSPLIIINRSPPSKKFIPRSLSAIAAHSYFGAIQSFTFSYSSRVPRLWPTVLSRFSLLSELNTSTQHATDVVCALIHPKLDGSPLCPSLGRITFRKRSAGGGPSIDPVLFDALRQFRAELQCPAIRVVLHHPGKRVEELY